ncbi:hypothetical protein WJ96_07705 [Burkholderia ubonensis]|uniref:CdiI immunity protein domain-containing protein n=2 Tax=Burkholderia ubonensis TaxID=101571 RepID=A0AAW3N019_9BURK|nr:hypothetical protein WJ93_09505 [Burkholderia ubonensis]KVP97047.1 hypothetical protein WJ97_14610 [Burkholderia ubonensis]KVP98397.1 hypothetical protein WJ96_07705 [Burkholderia ubonensis]KVZ93096.1 hypothetical protein WL25_19370 [Burkholderia ubonensis]
MSFCAYVGVKADHALAELEELWFPCHFGINYRGWGKQGSPREAGWYWWGWDYAHWRDHVDYQAMLPPDASDEEKKVFEKVNALMNRSEPYYGFGPRKKWTVDEVFEDALDALMELKTSLEKSKTLTALLAHR